MKLKESCAEFAEPERLKSIVKKYSSFVSFPIKLNGEVINTVSALWTQDKKSVTPEQYKEFYRFISTSYDDPQFTLHFRTDAPIDLKCLLFVPSFHTEKFGQGRMRPGVNLYSRKVLIESKAPDLLPEWLRFVKGVVDSEDLPLSLSREKPQDSNLLKRIRDVLTRKVIRFLEEQAKDAPEKYKEFYTEYNYFLKEGACQDHKFMDQISKLLMFESSAKEEGSLISLDDYLSRCPPEQKEIFYLVAPTRTAALASPYYETFKKHVKEVLFLYHPIDDFVMNNIRTFSGRTLVSAENSGIDLGSAAAAEPKAGEAEAEAPDRLSDAEAAELCGWLRTELGGKVREVRTTSRLADSPAIVTDHESGVMRRMLKMVDQSNSSKQAELPPQVLEINPQHPIIVGISRAADKKLAVLVAEQLFDNALIAAGLVDDPRIMLARLNSLLAATLRKAQ